MTTVTQQAQARALAALHDPARRRLLELIAHSARPMSVDDAVKATGTPRSTIATHLDRLVDAGVLTVAFERRTGRTGPGAGRPSKVYTVVDGEIVVGIPPRDYALMGEVLAGALGATSSTGASMIDTLHRVAEKRGAALVRERGSLAAALESVGYEPVRGDDGVTTLLNCPFHRIAASHTDLVCGANLALLRGMTAGEAGVDAAFSPGAGHCCVEIVAAPPSRVETTVAPHLQQVAGRDDSISAPHSSQTNSSQQAGSPPDALSSVPTATTLHQPGAAHKVGRKATDNS